MITVAFLVHAGRERARQIAVDTASWLATRGGQGRVLTLSAADRVVEQGSQRPLAEVDLSGADLAVSLGGDGTFLRLASVASAQRVPLLGVNLGRLGYLLDTPPDRLTDALERFESGATEVEERAVLDVTVSGDIVPLGSPGWRWKVLNEVVLEKTVPGHTIHLVTSVDGELLATYRADGVLVATPTGSTAYNLSAGGPVLSPTLRACVLTPVAAHLSSGASVVLDAAHAVTLEVGPGRPAVLVLDGLPVGRLEPDAAVTCVIAGEPARLVRFEKRPLATEMGSMLAPVTPSTGAGTTAPLLTRLEDWGPATPC